MVGSCCVLIERVVLSLRVRLPVSSSYKIGFIWSFCIW